MAGMKSNLKIISSFVLSLMVCTVLVLGSSGVSATVPYITERINLTPSGSQTSGGNVQDPPTISQDGRYVAFMSSSSDIVASDTNGQPDVFVRDRKTSTTIRANVSSSGAQLPSATGDYAMSANGRFILFTYAGSGVVSGSVNGKWQLYLRDLKNNTNELVSVNSSGSLADDHIGVDTYDVSSDGRYVVFATNATNLVSGDTNGQNDVFVRDRKLGTTKILSKSNSGTLGDKGSYKPVVSCDGTYVAFRSSATNLVAGDTNAKMDVFLVDRVNNDSITNITITGNKDSAGDIDISCNGERLIFGSSASNLVLNDANVVEDIFAYSIIDGTFQRVNLDSSGNEVNSSISAIGASSIDFSGRYVTFWSDASSLTSGDTNNQADVFMRDLINGDTQIVSKRSSTAQTTAYSFYPSISLDGREVIFASGDSGLVSGDTNGSEDIFVSKTGI